MSRYYYNIKKKMNLKFSLLVSVCDVIKTATKCLFLSPALVAQNFKIYIQPTKPLRSQGEREKKIII